MWRLNLVLISLILSVSSEKFKVIKEWNYLNFTWPNEEIYKTSVSRGIYVPENNIIAGIKYFDSYFYLTLPRMKKGVPATLTRIPAGISQDTSPLLTVFPSWDMNKLDDCNALQNVQDVEIDTKGQMWIIDGGRTETLSPNPVARCPPKLIIFDITKNMITTAYTFPDNVVSYNSSFLYDIVVDVTNDGYAYISDNSARDPGIVVFSLKDHQSWKIRHSQSMKADPAASTFRVNGIMISAPINIASIALGPKIQTSNDRIIVSEDREIFYSPLSSLHIFSLNTSILRDKINGMNNEEYQGHVKDYGLKTSQSVGMTMDNQGVMYYSLLATNSIAKWNILTPFQTGQKIIARDEKFLEWPNSFAFDQSGNITVLVNRLNRFIYEKLNLNEPNFRLITSRVGGKSYLYDESAESETSITSSTLNPPIPNLPDPQLLPGSVQDPFLVPQPVQNHKTEPSLEVESNAEPDPETTTLRVHDHTNHNHRSTNHDYEMTSASNSEKKIDNLNSASQQITPTLLSILFACTLFTF